MNWSEQLVEGDDVVLSTPTGTRLVTVKRVSDSYIFIGKSLKFRRTDGGMDDKYQLINAGPTIVEMLRHRRRRQNLVKQAANVKWSDLPTNLIEQIIGMVNAQPGLPDHN